MVDDPISILSLVDLYLEHLIIVILTDTTGANIIHIFPYEQGASRAEGSGEQLLGSNRCLTSVASTS
jgi:hypothetical protein